MPKTKETDMPKTHHVSSSDIDWENNKSTYIGVLQSSDGEWEDAVIIEGVGRWDELQSDWYDVWKTVKYDNNIKESSRNGVVYERMRAKGWRITEHKTVALEA
jgi:DNA polymerase IIIc chi subunit